MSPKCHPRKEIVTKGEVKVVICGKSLSPGVGTCHPWQVINMVASEVFTNSGQEEVVEGTISLQPQAHPVAGFQVITIRIWSLTKLLESAIPAAARHKKVPLCLLPRRCCINWIIDSWRRMFKWLHLRYWWFICVGQTASAPECCKRQSHESQRSSS